MPSPNFSQVVAAVAALQREGGYATYAGLAARFGISLSASRYLVQRVAAGRRLVVFRGKTCRITVPGPPARKG